MSLCSNTLAGLEERKSTEHTINLCQFYENHKIKKINHLFENVHSKPNPLIHTLPIVSPGISITLFIMVGKSTIFTMLSFSLIATKVVKLNIEAKKLNCLNWTELIYGNEFLIWLHSCPKGIQNWYIMLFVGHINNTIRNFKPDHHHAICSHYFPFPIS